MRRFLQLPKTPPEPVCNPGCWPECRGSYFAEHTIEEATNLIKREDARRIFEYAGMSGPWMVVNG